MVLYRTCFDPNAAICGDHPIDDDVWNVRHGTLPQKHCQCQVRREDRIVRTSVKTQSAPPAVPFLIAIGSANCKLRVVKPDAVVLEFQSISQHVTVKCARLRTRVDKS